MSNFEDHLWDEVVRQHGRDLELARRPAATHRRPRPRLLAGTTLGLAAVGTALVLALGATTSPPAFAVTSNPNGTVTVTIIKLAGVSGANRALAALQVRARVAVAVSCFAPTSENRHLSSGIQDRFQRLRATVASMTIDPRRIPAGRVLVLRAYSDGRLVHALDPRIARAYVHALHLSAASSHNAHHGATSASTGNSGTTGNSGAAGNSGIASGPPGQVPEHATCPWPSTGNSGNTGNSGAG